MKLTSLYLEDDDVKKAQDICWEKRFKVSELYRNAIHWYMEEDQVQKLINENIEMSKIIEALEKEIVLCRKPNVEDDPELKDVYDEIRESFKNYYSSENHNVSEGYMLKARFENFKDVISFDRFKELATEVKNETN